MKNLKYIGLYELRNLDGAVLTSKQVDDLEQNALLDCNIGETITIKEVIGDVTEDREFHIRSNPVPVRNGLICANCKSNEFEVRKTEIPSAISIVCNKCGCVTPLVVLSDSGKEMAPINYVKTMELYQKSYHYKINEKMIRDARYNH